MAAHSSILAWRILWTEEQPGGLQSMEMQKSDTAEQLIYSLYFSKDFFFSFFFFIYLFFFRIFLNFILFLNFT